MSGKLIMKRKLDKTKQPAINNKVELDESSVSMHPSSSSSASTLSKQHMECNKSDEAFISQPASKRIRCDTPPTHSSDLDLSSPEEVNRQNRHLLEAIQLKILELQNELDDFEHDVEAHEEEYYHIIEAHHDRPINQMSEQDAEALGFAMCAQETLLFLQRGGISADSILYRRLYNALVGPSQSDRE